MYDQYFSNFGRHPVDILSPMIYANFQPQSILGSREEDFF